MKTNSNLNYEKPEILEEVNCIEPVETGCCLRSCGGSPHHLNSSVSEELSDKFRKISDK